MVTGLISPFDVHAASVPGQYDVVDLLASGVFPEGDLSITKSASSYTFTWDVTASSSMAFVYLNIYAPTAPSSVTLNGVSGTRVYSGAFYQYKFSMSRVLSTCTVKVNFTSTVSRTVSIGYAVGAVSGQEVFTTCTMFSRGYSATAWAKTTDNRIPFSGSYGSNITDPPTTGAITNDFVFSFNPSISAADYFTIHLVVPGGHRSGTEAWTVPWSEDPAFYVGTSSGSSPSTVAPLSIISSDEYYDSTTSIASYRGAYHFIYTVDVSGFDLLSYDIFCSIKLIGDKISDTRYGFYFRVLSACVGVNVDDGDSSRGLLPWLGTQFSNIKSAITSLGTTIASQFSSLKTSLSSWFSSLESKIQSAINPTPDKSTTDSQQGVSDDISAMDQFEQDGFGKIENGMSDMQADISTGVKSFLPALSFIRKYTDHVASGISDYLLVFTLPIFVGLFLFICNRLPGVTRFGSSKPKKED